MKLSKTQRMVLKMMSEGWELGQVTIPTSDRGAWLQQGGCGRGGRVMTVHHGTLQALWKRELIMVNKRGFPSITYKLTEEGKQEATT